MLRLERGTYFGSVENVRAVAGLQVTRSWHPGRSRLPTHAHERPYMCLVVRGGFAERADQHDAAECRAGSVVWHSAGQPHDDVFGEMGACCINIELDDTWVSRLRDAVPALPRWGCLSSHHAPWFVRRVHRELAGGDSVSGFAIEALTAAILAELCRGSKERTARPAWLRAAVDRLRGQFARPPSVTVLSAELGLHRSHFARCFHAHMHCTVGEYVRRLRVEWVCEQLRRDHELPLSAIALRAGFCDQAHLCRVFKRVTGTTPTRYGRRNSVELLAS